MSLQPWEYVPNDADMMRPHDERWLLERLARRPWRDGLAEALADSAPGLYARLTDPGHAALLSLLEIADGACCLDATCGWGQIAVPLARRARVVVLAPSAVRAAIVRRIADQEGVGLTVAVGAPGRAAFAAAAFDVVLLHDLPEMGNPAASEPTALAALRNGARLLRPGGRLYLGAANDLADLVGGAPVGDARSNVRTLARYTALFAPAGLTQVAAYACFPDHEQPRFLVPLALVDDFVADPAYATPRPAWNASASAGTYAGLAGEGIAHHFAPSFAFILQLEGAAPSAPGVASTGDGAPPATHCERAS